MRFITDFKLLSLFLSLSIAAPIAQYLEGLEGVPAGNQFDNGIESSSNKLFTDDLGTSSPGAAADNAFLMAARRQREDHVRFRPSKTLPLKGSIPDEDRCLPGSPGSNCQPQTEPTQIPVGEQSDIPDPWLDEAQEAGGALGIFGLWNLLNDPSPAVHH